MIPSVIVALGLFLPPGLEDALYQLAFQPLRVEAVRTLSVADNLPPDPRLLYLRTASHDELLLTEAIAVHSDDTFRSAAITATVGARVFSRMSVYPYFDFQRRPDDTWPVLATSGLPPLLGFGLARPFQPSDILAIEIVESGQFDIVNLLVGPSRILPANHTLQVVWDIAANRIVATAVLADDYELDRSLFEFNSDGKVIRLIRKMFGGSVVGVWEVSCWANAAPEALTPEMLGVFDGAFIGVSDETHPLFSTASRWYAGEPVPMTWYTERRQANAIATDPRTHAAMTSVRAQNQNRTDTWPFLLPDLGECP